MIKSAENQYVRISRNFPVSLSFCFSLKFFRKVGNFTRTLWMTVRFTIQVVYGKNSWDGFVFLIYYLRVKNVRFCKISIGFHLPGLTQLPSITRYIWTTVISFFKFNIFFSTASFILQVGISNLKTFFCVTSFAKNAASNHHY